MALEPGRADGTVPDADGATAATRAAMALGGALVLLGVVADPRLLAAGLVVWLLYGLSAVATG